jgi:hypothetical protein
MPDITTYDPLTRENTALLLVGHQHRSRPQCSRAAYESLLPRAFGKEPEILAYAEISGYSRPPEFPRRPEFPRK